MRELDWPDRDQRQREQGDPQADGQVTPAGREMQIDFITKLLGIRKFAVCWCLCLLA